jgi:hypothetical protein
MSIFVRGGSPSNSNTNRSDPVLPSKEWIRVQIESFIDYSDERDKLFTLDTKHDPRHPTNSVFQM